LGRTSILHPVVRNIPSWEAARPRNIPHINRKELLKNGNDWDNELFDNITTSLLKEL
jgi:hypothetical protein